MVSDFFTLFYPRICASCAGNLSLNEDFICVSCQFKLPKTQYSITKDNALCKLFWGRTNIETAAAYYYFNNGSKVQHLIHQLKYKGQKELGFYLGEKYGQELILSPLFKSINVIIPIPLHPQKLKKRGYNQSEYFAKGLSKSMQKQVNTQSLIRLKESSTQTKKTRYERWENVENIFSIWHAKSLKNKHVLLVDDVITTGATIEAATNTLLQIEGVKISIASIAFAEKV